MHHAAGTSLKSSVGVQVNTPSVGSPRSASLLCCSAHMGYMVHGTCVLGAGSLRNIKPFLLFRRMKRPMSVASCEIRVSSWRSARKKRTGEKRTPCQEVEGKSTKCAPRSTLHPSTRQPDRSIPRYHHLLLTRCSGLGRLGERIFSSLFHSLDQSADPAKWQFVTIRTVVDYTVYC